MIVAEVSGSSEHSSSSVVEETGAELTAELGGTVMVAEVDTSEVSGSSSQSSSVVVEEAGAEVLTAEVAGGRVMVGGLEVSSSQSESSSSVVVVVTGGTLVWMVGDSVVVEVAV